jgi:hypothetical protein
MIQMLPKKASHEISTHLPAKPEIYKNNEKAWGSNKPSTTLLGSKGIIAE